MNKYLIPTRVRTGPEGVWAVADTLKRAGWVQRNSGDGLMLSGAAAVQHPGTGSGGLNNGLAWLRLDDPAGLRSIVLQRSAVAAGYGGHASWRVKYAQVRAYIDDGTPTITARAAYERVVLGGGTNEAPICSILFSALSGATVLTGIALDNEPHGFCFASYLDPTEVASGSLFLDPLTGTHPADRDPVVIGACSLAQLSSDTNGAFAHMKAGDVLVGPEADGWVRVAAARPSNASGSLLGLTIADAGTGGRTTPLRVAYARRSGLAAPTGFKGFSTLLRAVGPAAATGLRLSESRPQDHVVVAQYMIPSDGVPF